MGNNIKQKLKFILGFIDLKMGIKMAIVMGALVFIINYYLSMDLTYSIVAMLKQGLYTFFLGGTVLKLCEHIVNLISSKGIAVVAATVIPSVLTIALVFGVHTLKGTPRPFESTLPTLLVVPGTIFWAFRKRKKQGE